MGADSLCILFVGRRGTMSCPVVVQSVLAVVAALFNALGRVAFLLRTHAHAHIRRVTTATAIARQRANPPAVARLFEPWNRAWQLLAAFMPNLLTWLRHRRSSWSKNCRQRVPSVLYACERMHLQLISLLHMPDVAVVNFVERKDLHHLLQRMGPRNAVQQHSCATS